MKVEQADMQAGGRATTVAAGRVTSVGSPLSRMSSRSSAMLSPGGSVEDAEAAAEALGHVSTDEIKSAKKMGLGK